MIKFIRIKNNGYISSYQFNGVLLSGIVNINENTKEVIFEKFICDRKNPKREKEFIEKIIVPKIIENNFPKQYTWATH